MGAPHTPQTHIESPFVPENTAAYRRWRDRKLACQPASLGDLVVEIRDPLALRESERQAILDRCRRTNMALYVSPPPGGRETPLALGRQLGLHGLDRNWLADDDGLTSLTVVEGGTRRQYIPYSDRPIKWHTDGYYNAPDRQIHGLLLHCEQRAAQGGENALMDHEIAYILLREADPEHIRALMKDDAMTIPARMEGDETAREDRSGPVFSVDPLTGNLHMRYTVRTHHVQWKNDPATRAAVACLTQILEGDSPYIYRGLLESGMGLISNNVLHDRTAFKDDQTHRRLLYRARYYDRIAGTNWND
jgi:hypothetical protein